MRTETPVTIYLKDYTAPAWWIDQVALHIAIHADYAEVRARLHCRRNTERPELPLVLDGEELSLCSIGLNGIALAPSRYELGEELLTLLNTPDHPLPEQFTLDTVVRSDPDTNTQPSGLYRSKEDFFPPVDAYDLCRITS